MSGGSVLSLQFPICFYRGFKHERAGCCVPRVFVMLMGQVRMGAWSGVLQRLMVTVFVGFHCANVAFLCVHEHHVCAGGFCKHGR